MMATSEELAMTPAMPVPGGRDPDFDQMTEFPDILITSFAISFFIATFLLTLRLYTTTAIMRSFDLDDGLIIVAWGCSLAYSAIMIKAIDFGFGKHLWNVSALASAGYLSLLTPSVMTYSWSVSTAKLAMLALYHRISSRLLYRITVYATALGILGYQITFTIIFLGPCKATNPNAGECLNKGAIAQVVLNIAFDVIVILIPLPTIIHLNMPRKQKALLMGVVALGSAATIVSAIKVSWVIQMTGNPDVTYTQGQATILSIWEANVSIWCNNLIRLKPFIRHQMPRLYALMGSTNPSSNSKSNPSRLRPWEGDKVVSASHELSAMRKSAMPLGSNPDLTADGAQSGAVTVTTEYTVESHPSGRSDRRDSAESILRKH